MLNWFLNCFQYISRIDCLREGCVSSHLLTVMSVISSNVNDMYEFLVVLECKYKMILLKRLGLGLFP